jgi:PGF-pre-PGF domain-containing protein
MVNTKTYWVCLAVLCLLSVPLANAVLPLPAAYYGNITVHGEPAPVGTIITAKINGVEKGEITTTSRGVYGEKPRDESLVVQGGAEGDLVHFYVNGVAAREEVPWIEGDGPKAVDLTVVGMPTPTPTPKGDGGSGGSSRPPPMSTPKEKPLMETGMKIIKSIEAGKVESVTFVGFDICRISIEVDAHVSDVSVMVEEVEEPGEITNAAGIVYAYYNITATNLTGVNVTAGIEFKVNRSWIADESVKEETIKLNKYEEEWNALPTTKNDADAYYVYFAAVTPGFSLFAINGGQGAEVAATPTFAPTTVPAPRASPMFLIPVIIVVLVIAGIFIIALRQK